MTDEKRQGDFAAGERAKPKDRRATSRRARNENRRDPRATSPKARNRNRRDPRDFAEGQEDQPAGEP